MVPVRKMLAILALSFLPLTASPVPASAYQIDCAILLCLAGGFPPSAPCTAARAEMIRRITPWPIEPPLQIWRCPMRAGFFLPNSPFADEPIPVASTAPPMPLPILNLGNRGAAHKILQVYDSSIESYLAAIKVYDLTYRRHRSSDGDCNVSSRFRIGSYDRSGEFHWRRADVNASPTWVFNASYTQCTSASFRGVGLEWQDYQGGKGTEVVKY